jgi:phasin family protein
MADQKAAPEAIEGTAEAAPAEAARAEAPATDATPAKAEPKPEAAEAKAEAAPARKPAARKPAAVKRKAPKAPAKPEPRARKAAARPAAKSKKKTRKPARAGTRNQGVKIMTKQTNGIDSGLFAADQLKTVFGDANERARAAVERSAKIVEELADLTRGNVEAFVASSKVAAKGVEALGQDAAEYSRKSFEEASAALKGFAEVRSATDLFKLQGDFARAAFDQAVAESARMSETVLKLAGDVAEPITSRYTVAAERVKTLAA